MFVPIILDFENNGLKFMFLKYIRFFDICMKKSWPIITHEEFDKYEINFSERNELKEEMKNKYGYSLYNYEERKSVKQYFFSSDLFKNKEAQYGSKLEMVLHLIKESDEEIRNQIGYFFDIIENDYNEKIEGVLYFASVYKSIKDVCLERNIPMIAYETGPIRKDNYRIDTSYFCYEGLYGDKEIEKNFDLFKKEYKKNQIPILSRKELVAMFIGDNNLEYLEKYDQIPQYEIGVACGCAIVVPYFAIDKYTDHELIDDIFDEYKYSDVLVRLHPGDMYTASYRLGENRIDCSPNPFEFLTSVKRIAAVGSNMLFEAMLWQKIACSKTKVMPATLFCQRDYREKKENEETELFVNFFVFCFLVPMELAFDEKYIRWRLSNPSKREVYLYHLDYYLEKFQMRKNWLKFPKDQRLELIKIYRGSKGRYISKSEEKKEGVSINTGQSNGESEYYRKYIETKEWLDSILNSTSWKITKPFRNVLDIIRKKK